MLFKHNPNFKPIWAEGKKPISNFLSFSRQVIKELGWKGGETCRTAWVPEHLHSAGLGGGRGRGWGQGRSRGNGKSPWLSHYGHRLAHGGHAVSQPERHVTVATLEKRRGCCGGASGACRPAPHVWGPESPPSWACCETSGPSAAPRCWLSAATMHSGLRPPRH